MNSGDPAQPAPGAPGLNDRLQAVLGRLLPLAAGAASGLRFITLLGIGLVVWLFVWMFWLKGFSFVTSALVSGIAALPVLVLSRFWYAVAEIRNLPNLVREMGSGIKRDLGAAVSEIASGDRKRALNLIGQAKNLFEIRSLLGQLSDVAGQYVSIGTLLNPLSLIVGVIALLAVGVLLIVGLILALGAMF